MMFLEKSTQKSKDPNQNLKFKGVPGNFRPPEYYRWIPYPILAQKRFYSPPGNPNRGLRGRHRPLPGADIWAEKQSIKNK